MRNEEKGMRHEEEEMSNDEEEMRKGLLPSRNEADRKIVYQIRVTAPVQCQFSRV